MMETWFLLTIGSAVLVGFHVFGRKVIAERGYDVALITTYSAVVSSSFLFLVAILRGTDFTVSSYVLILVILSAVIYMFANLSTNTALKAIDTTIFFSNL